MESWSYRNNGITLRSSYFLTAPYFGTVSFTSSDSLATLPKNYTFKTTDKGEHTFSELKLPTKGKQTITIMDTQTKTILGSITINVT